MKLNQVFELLKKASTPRDAKIVTEYLKENNKTNLFAVLCARNQLSRGFPVAKIIGRKWFYGLSFYTNKYTLDPRPDSETLIEAVLKRAKSKEQRANTAPLTILDLGTGTGCLVCALIKNLPNAIGVGVDISRGAIRVAKKNVKDLGLSDEIKIQRANFNKSEIRNQKSEIFDIIISNPPYIAIGDLYVNIGATHDPKIALYSGRDGLDAYRDIAKSVKKLLKPSGLLFLEIGSTQGKSVRKIFSDFKFIESYKDLGGIERVLELENK